ncbi:MAG TPA: FAD-dependent monooxygenase, partial [Burkholderiales bacterium]|nr:FAD-dependent monooxygenase [Burkholderiales bacterium]
MTARYDVVVVGSGPVGAAFALAIKAHGATVLLLESREHGGAPPGVRPIALSYGSRLIFERLGVWTQLKPATPIARIHVSQRGHFGRAELTAREAGFPELGYVVDYASLVSILDAAVSTCGLEVLRGATVSTVAHGPTSARVEFISASGVGECMSSLVVIADGSAVAADIDVTTRDYGQTAVTARIDADRPHRQTAYERFTPHGPIALLPLEGSYGLVWTMRTLEAEDLLRASPAAFLDHLQKMFGERAGRFTGASARSAQRLSLRVAQRTTWGRSVVIGNAAQSLHPVAGQGFNLGLRDAWELATEIHAHGVDDGNVVNAYGARRFLDRAGGIAFTDGLV